MTDLFSLVKDTGAYKTVAGDKENGRLSHAYLLLSADKENLKEYLKIFAQTIACGEKERCGKCRSCRLIEQQSYPDAFFYPAAEGSAILTEDINDVIEKTYLKPVESDKKIFVLSGGETMNASAQNKLLKTLEEPPRGVHILIGSLSEFPLLPTVKSRMKKLEIPAFPAEKLFAALKEDCPDEEKLKRAIACGDGTAGTAKALYGDENLAAVSLLAEDTLVNMKSSKDVLKYSVKISEKCPDVDGFLSVTELYLRDLLVYFEGKKELALNPETLERTVNAGFNSASCAYALEKITEARKRKKFNGGGAMLTEWLLFSVLEGKHKWQKL